MKTENKWFWMTKRFSMSSFSFKRISATVDVVTASSKTAAKSAVFNMIIYSCIKNKQKSYLPIPFNTSNCVCIVV